MIDGHELLRRRADRGLSQGRLAKLAGVNPQTIKRLEDGADGSELPLAVLGRLANALQVEPAALLRPSDGSRTRREISEPQTLDPSGLDYNAAKLLRRIHRGEDIRRTMTRTERQLTLPSLIKRGLVTMTNKGAVLTSLASESLTHPR